MLLVVRTRLKIMYRFVDPNAMDSEFSSNRITRIVTTDFPNYFAIVTRIRQEVHAVGPEGGIITSTVVPQVQAIFPEGALTKKIKVGLQVIYRLILFLKTCARIMQFKVLYKI